MAFEYSAFQRKDKKTIHTPQTMLAERSHKLASFVALLMFLMSSISSAQVMFIDFEFEDEDSTPQVTITIMTVMDVKILTKTQMTITMACLTFLTNVLLEGIIGSRRSLTTILMVAEMILKIPTMTMMVLSTTSPTPGALGWISTAITDYDGDGCKDDSEDLDDDNDGVLDGADDCDASTTSNLGWISSALTDHDSDGCQDSGEDTDDDNDGIVDWADDDWDADWSPGALTDYDSDGCRDAGEDLDDDNDGVTDYPPPLQLRAL